MSGARPSPPALGLIRWAQETPDRVAVSDGERDLTFAELSALAGTLGRQMVERLGPGWRTAVPVPIVAGRDLASTVALHAASRAGVPCVPIDDTLPPAAVADLLARVGGPALGVVARPDQRALLPPSLDVLEVPATVDDPIDAQVVEPEHVDRVMFTSGSTGRPKGVVHRWEVMDSFDALHVPTEQLHIAMISSFGSSAGGARIKEIAQGHSLTIVDPTTLDPVELLERFDRARVTEITLVPSLAAQIVDRWPDGRTLGHVRWVRTFGEALAWEHVPGLRRLVPPEAAIVSSYGATECAARLMSMVITADDDLGTGRVPLGRVLAPDLVRLEPVDDDGPNQIVVLRAVARGYLDDPELTARRFGVDDSGTRYWRSGDLATLDPDGCYHHLGRVDDLVKIRGRLVEPAEPERVLHQIPGVRRAVVLPHTGERGVTRLVAHLEVDDEVSLTPAQVRHRLAEEIAPHLVPSPLVRHDRLPQLPGGKVDRAGLRAAPVVPWRSPSARGPRDPLDRAVIAACQEILELEPIGLDDDLWELGLDSLAAVELTAACSELGFGELAPDAPLEHATPAALAALLRRAPRRESARPSPGVVLNVDGTQQPIVAFPGAGGNAVVYHWLGRALGPDQPLLVVEPRGLHSRGRPDRRYPAVVARASEVVQTHLPDGPVTLAGHSIGGMVALEVAHRLGAEGRAVHVVLLDTRGARDAGEPPAPPRLRARLARRSPARLVRGAVFRVRTRILVLWPGRPRPLVARHQAFVRIARRAWRGYTTRPASFPVTLVHVADSTAPRTWGPLFPQLETREVPGTHLSMLQPPHVQHLAAALTDVHTRHLDRFGVRNRRVAPTSDARTV